MDTTLWQRLISNLERVGEDKADTDDVRLQKRLLVAIAVMISPAALIWGGIYLAFDETIAATIPLTYAVVSAAGVAILATARNVGVFRSSQLVAILLLPFLLMVSLGGFVDSSAVILWSLLCPLGAMLFVGRRQAIGWFFVFLGLLAVSVALEPFVRSSNSLPTEVVIAFFAMNVGAVSAVAFVLLRYFIKLLEHEREKSERLLLNVLPQEVAAVLKEDSGIIADQFDHVSVLFADVVGSTALAARLTPTELVESLNEAFSYFDSLVDKYDLEKIRTIGDNYMVASGVPRPRGDHAQALANMALEMKSYSGDGPAAKGAPLRFRIGMNSGTVVAGVIGYKKFHYDIWGDAVNTASHMESHGESGRIQIARPIYELLKDDFVCQPRGRIEVKGKGEMETWFLNGALGSPVPS